MLVQFEEINEALDEIGLSVYTDKGETMREVMAVEILSRKYPFIKNYQKDVFIKQASDDTKELLKQEQKLIGKK